MPVSGSAWLRTTSARVRSGIPLRLRRRTAVQETAASRHRAAWIGKGTDATLRPMHHSITIGPAYIKAEMVDRKTAEETRRFVNAQLAALRESGLHRMLVSVRSSRPVFKVSGWNI